MILVKIIKNGTKLDDLIKKKSKMHLGKKKGLLRFLIKGYTFIIYFDLLEILTPVDEPPRQCVWVLMASWCGVSYPFYPGL